MTIPREVSLNGGKKVVEEKHASSFQELRTAMRLSGDSANPREVAKYLERLGWKKNQQTPGQLTKSRLLVELTPDENKSGSATSPHATSASDFDARIVLAREGYQAGNGARTSLPTLLLAQSSTTVYTEIESVKQFSRLRYTTRDLLRALGDQLKGRFIERVTGEELSAFLDLYDFINDPKSILPLNLGEAITSARGVYALVGEEANSLLRIYSNVGAIEVPRYKAVQVPSGSLKSFLIENKTLELVFEERVSQIYANQQQFRDYIRGNGYVVTENVLRKIYAENQVPFYAKATYFPQ